MTEIIKTEDLGNKINVFYAKNGMLIGEFSALEDGFWYYWPERERQGCWSAYVMRAIADKLDELNRLIEAQLAAELSENKSGDMPDYWPKPKNT